MKTRSMNLRGFNTLSIDVAADSYHVIDSVNELNQWRAGESGKEFFVLGGGSNVVFSRNPSVPVLHMRGSRVDIESRDGAVLVTASAGHPWHHFVEVCLAAGAFGLENLALIPGTVGASPIQNIGAYGVEMRDFFHSLTAWDADSGRLLTLSSDDCCFGYRNSVFKTSSGRRLVITSVTFRLSATPKIMIDYGDVRTILQDMLIEKPTPRDVFDAVCRIRRSKLPDPDVLPNVGSFFKNPILEADALARLRRGCPDVPQYAQNDGRAKVAAGWLIDQCGWKGRRVGNAVVHERQALVLINLGTTADDVLRLAELIRADVFDRFLIELEVEPIVL